MDTSVNSSSNSSIHPLKCKESLFTFLSLFMANILLIPLFIAVLYVGFQQWRKQRLGSTAAMMSHSDIFTFHMVTLELISITGSGIYCYGIFTTQTLLMWGGLSIFSVILPGQILFHLLTCVERYLAVVHPITYLGLRQAGGIRLRHIVIGCVWLLCFLMAGLSKVISLISQVMLLVISSILVSVCSLCVLCALIRPRPGEVGANRGRVDQSKQRAVYTIMVIMGALLLKFLSTLVSTAMFMSLLLSECEFYVLLWSTAWFSLPSSLVLPLLFLHRAGKLPGCTHNTASV